MLANENLIADVNQNQNPKKRGIRISKNTSLLILTAGSTFVTISIGIYNAACLIFDFVKTNWEDDYLIQEVEFLLLIIARCLLIIFSLYPIYPAYNRSEGNYAPGSIKFWLHLICFGAFITIWILCILWTFMNSDLIFIFFGVISFIAAFMVHSCSDSPPTNLYAASWLA